MATSEHLSLGAQIQALEDGRGYHVRSDLRVLEVAGTDARTWLNDLVTGAIGVLSSGEALDSLFLTPTGHVQATCQVQLHDDRFLVLQDPFEPKSLHDLLKRYVLSSDVRLTDPTGQFHGFWTPGTMIELVPSEELERTHADYAARDWVAVGRNAVDAHRIWRGQPRFPIDLTTASLPAEHEPLMLATIDFSKGCFLGQESVAKVRNLGHPSHQIVSLWSAEPVVVGEAIFDAGREAGIVTSVATRGEETRLIGRIRWSKGAAPAFHTGEGNPLHRILA